MRRGAGMGKPMLSAPAATDNARLVSNQQRLAHLGFAAHQQNALRR